MNRRFSFFFYDISIFWHNERCINSQGRRTDNVFTFISIRTFSTVLQNNVPVNIYIYGHRYTYNVTTCTTLAGNLYIMYVCAGTANDQRRPRTTFPRRYVMKYSIHVYIYIHIHIYKFEYVTAETISRRGTGGGNVTKAVRATTAFVTNRNWPPFAFQYTCLIYTQSMRANTSLPRKFSSDAENNAFVVFRFVLFLNFFYFLLPNSVRRWTSFRCRFRNERFVNRRNGVLYTRGVHVNNNTYRKRRVPVNVYHTGPRRCRQTTSRKLMF